MKKIIAIMLCLCLSGCSGAIPTSGNPDKSYGWGLKKIQNSAPEVPQYIKDMLRENNSVYMGNPDDKKVYLTFDEGYENGYTSVILDTLKEKNVKAAFFITGDYLNRSEDLVKRMIDEGHIVGNHTIGHRNLAKMQNEEDIKKEITDLSDLFKEKFGTEMIYVRPPEGEYSERVLSVMNDMGLRCVFWSFAYKDWIADSKKGKDFAVGQIMPYLHNGMVILLHAVSEDNAEALPEVIDKARAQGFEFGVLDDIYK
ncbi:MAG: polysaccharide deacetylase family protein [Clostridia bacterium]|nr:polysaccharide deacetylase family protein [Clostridia bacterium]